MQISPIATNNIKKINVRNVPKPNSTPFKGRIKEWFSDAKIRHQDIKNEQKKQKKEYDDFALKNGKVTKEELFEIQKKSPHILCKAQKKVDNEQKYYKFKIKPELAAKTALYLKEHFDMQYGKDSYRIISVGTSPAIFTEAIKELGVETIFLPISEIHKHRCNTIEKKEDRDIHSFKNIQIAMGYLKHKGLKNDEKKNIILDYTDLKATLDVISELIKENFEIDDEKIIKCDLMSQIYKLQKNIPEANHEGKKITSFLDNFSHDIRRSICEVYTNVPHFSIYEVSNMEKGYGWIPSGQRENVEIFQDFEEFSTELGRCYMLLELNELEKKGILKENKQKKSGQNPD